MQRHFDAVSTCQMPGWHYGQPLFVEHFADAVNFSEMNHCEINYFPLCSGVEKVNVPSFGSDALYFCNKFAQLV